MAPKIKGTVVRLTAGILGIYDGEGQRTAIMMPEGATVRVVSGQVADSRMVDVIWEGRTLAVFAEDLSERGKEVVSTSA